MKTIFLDPNTWNLAVDSGGNIAVADDPYALAQNVSCAVRTFRGEVPSDLDYGIPYRESVLGSAYDAVAVRKHHEDIAKTVSGVTNALAVIDSFEHRVPSGFIKITDSDGVDLTADIDFPTSAISPIDSPTVIITAPANNMTVSGSVLLSAIADSLTGILGVQFQLDGLNIDVEITTAPFQTILHSQFIDDGNHVLTSIARTANGVASSNIVKIKIENAVINTTTVNITSPLPSAVISGNQVITANVSAGVIGVQFQRDGIAINAEVTAPPWQTTWDTSGFTDGFYDLTAVARTESQSATSEPINVHVDNIPLTISITAPANAATVSGFVSVTVTTNNDAEVGSVMLLVDGVERPRDYAAPWSINWDSSNAVNGSHSLVVQAWSPSTGEGDDGSQLIATSSAITVTSSNVITLPAPVNGGISNAVEASTTVAAAPIVWPAGYAVDDAAFIFVESGINDVITFPAGWTHVIGSPQSDGSATKATLVWKRAASLAEPDISLGLASSDHFVARMHLYRGCRATGAPYEEISSNSQSGSSTATMPQLELSMANVKVVYASVRSNDSADVATYGTISNASMSSISERYEMGTILGNGGGGMWTTATPIAAGLTGAATSAMTVSPNCINFAMCLVAQDPPSIDIPSVSVTAPADAATVSGSITVSASASSTTGILGVQFKLDGVNLGSEDTSSPYSITWDTTGATDGSHTITAVARTATGSAGSSAVNVTVANITRPTVVGSSNMVSADTVTSAAAMTWPTHAANDVGFILAEMGQTDTLTPSGWTHVTGSPFGGGTPGSRLALMWKRAASSSEANISLGLAPVDHFVAQMLVVRGCKTSGNPYLEIANNTVNNSSTVTMPAVTLTQADSLVMYASTRGNDNSGLAIYPGLTNAAMSSITEHYEIGTALGHGGGGRMATAIPIASGDTGEATETLGSAPNLINVTLALVNS